MIASLSNPLNHIHNLNNTLLSYFHVYDIMEIAFLITYIPLILIMYARVTGHLEQCMPLARAIYSRVGYARLNKHLITSIIN